MGECKYDDDCLLPLSGIQHFAFCPRQWALIHVEQQWSENVKTVEGKQLHERVDDPYFQETRKNVRSLRSVPLLSKHLGLYGVADLIEIHKRSDQSKEIFVVEYKRGKPKSDDRDAVQLCAQAMCLEEMWGVSISEGYLYYGETKHRLKISLDEILRKRVVGLASQMHDLYEKRLTPRASKNRNCRLCSLINLCLPYLSQKMITPSRYLEEIFSEFGEDGKKGNKNHAKNA